MPTSQNKIHVRFLNEIVAGLKQNPKALPSKYLYDERGSRLFDQICELDEYYLTRSEISIVKDNAREIAAQIGPGAMLIELGSGSSIKTRYVLENLVSPAAYVPVDISRDHLNRTAKDLRVAFPDIEVLPVAADFTKGFALPEPETQPSHSVVFFPGSTIGNFTKDQAFGLLDKIAAMVGQDGGLIIGLDLQKDPAIIEAAYNDIQGVTAEFNLNVLKHINNELGADFDLELFEHQAVYNREAGRVELGLVSAVDQSVLLGDERFDFARGEYVHTEYSHKYLISEFEEMAAVSGFSMHKCWTDENEYFAVLHLVIE